MIGRAVMLAALALSLFGCERRAAPEAKPSISYKTRAENAPISVERTHRLSDTETIRVVVIPGFPFGHKCVLYTGSQNSAMHCEDITPGQQ